MDPPRCHRLCDFFGTVAAFSVSLLFQFRCFLSFFCRSLFCFQRLFSGPLCGGAFPYGSEKSFLALAGRLLRSCCHGAEDFNTCFFALHLSCFAF